MIRWMRNSRASPPARCGRSCVTSGLPSTTGASSATCAVCAASSSSGSHLRPVQRQRRPEDVLDAHDVRPADLELRLGRVRLDCGLGRGRRRRPVLAPFVRQEGERHAEDVDVLRLEQARLRVDLVGRAPQAAPHHLLAQKLAGKGAQAHDVRHGLGVPAFARACRPRSRSGSARPACPALPTVSTIRRSSSACSSLVSLRSAGASSSSSSSRVVASPSSAARDGFLLRFGLLQHLRVDVQRPLRVAQFVDADLAVVEGVLDARRGLGAVGDGDHHRRRRAARLPSTAFAVSSQSLPSR